MKILQPPGWARPRGYSNGIAVPAGQLIFVGGQVGWNAQQVFESRDFVGQVAQALRNIAAVLAEAGAKPEHITRLTWYVVDRAEYNAHPRELGAAYRAVMGAHYPVMSAVEVTALMEADARVEIEATAVMS